MKTKPPEARRGGEAVRLPRPIKRQLEEAERLQDEIAQEKKNVHRILRTEKSDRPERKTARRLAGIITSTFEESERNYLALNRALGPLSRPGRPREAARYADLITLLYRIRAQGIEPPRWSLSIAVCTFPGFLDFLIKHRIVPEGTSIATLLSTREELIRKRGRIFRHATDSM